MCIIRPRALVAIALIISASFVARAARADENEKKLAESKAAWQKLRDTSGGNYEYDVTFQSWTGAGQTTTIVVRDNKPFERRLRKFDRRQAQVQVVGPDGKEAPQPAAADEGWKETAAQLGTHQGAAAPKTVDELYAEAEAVLGAPRQPHEKLYLSFHPNGVLKGCFVVDTRISDDAPRKGPSIAALRMAAGK